MKMMMTFRMPKTCTYNEVKIARILMTLENGGSKDIMLNDVILPSFSSPIPPTFWWVKNPNL